MTARDERGDGDGSTPIREAACLVLIDRTKADPRLLMGRRLPSQAFLPNKWVFPGGRVDDADHARSAATVGPTEVSPEDAGHLPFALAAIRETYEEAGLAVCDAHGTVAPRNRPLDRLKPLARAITPSGFPRRFDTWFYTAEWDCNHQPTGTPDGELLDLAWFTVDQVRALDLPYITRLIVDDVAMLLASPNDVAAPLVPFYFQALEGYTRKLISPAWPWPQP